MKFKSIRQLVMTIAVSLTAVTSWGAPVDIDQARNIAAKFKTEQSSLLKKSPVNPNSLSLAYTAQSAAGDCYYIFNSGNDGGYTIVAADDRIPQVLGYSDRGNFDPKRMPDNMKWWLNEYKKEIEYFLQNEDKFHETSAKLPEYKEIKPLLTTQWNQSAPYNNMCPMDGTSRSVTGCVATAMAQVMKHHNWPVNPKGSSGGVTFTGTTLDWANMIDDYSKGYTQVQADAVALLMRQCGASVNMMYSSSASGAYSPDVVPALYTYFDYNKAIKYLPRPYFSQQEWNKIVYDELAANRPVYYSGQADNGGHAFVCDGYKGNGYFHFNWGWGGFEDGYFLLFALNPSSGGIGSFEGGYNRAQAILTGVQKASANDGPMQCLLVAGDGYLYTFTSDGNVISFENGSMFYNPTGRTENLKIAFKLVNENNKSDVRIFGEFDSDLRKNYGYRIVGFELPSDLPLGTYRLTIVYKDRDYSESEWEDVMIPYGTRKYILIEKTSNGTKITNPSLSSGAKLIVNSVTPVTDTLYSGMTNTMQIVISNVSDNDFSGQITMKMARNINGSNAKEYKITSVIPAKTSVSTVFSQSLDVRPNTYYFRFSTQEQDSLGDPFKFIIKNFDTSVDENSNFYAEIKSPSLYSIGQGSAILELSAAKRETSKANSTKLGFRLYRKNDNKLLQSWSTSDVIFSNTSLRNFRYRIDVQNINNLNPGDYYWQIYDNNANQVISNPFFMKITEGPLTEDGLTYQIYDANTAEIMSSTADYKGSLSIPSKIKTNNVNRIAGDAFTFCGELQELTLPTTIGSIANAQFYGCEKLEKLTLESPIVPAVSTCAFAPEAASKIELRVANYLVNSYKRTATWEDFFFPAWNIEMEKDIKVISGLQNDTTGMPYAPYYVNRDSQLTIKLQLADGDEISYDYTIGNGQKVTKVAENGQITLPALGKENGSLRIYYSKQGGVDIITDTDSTVTVYTLDGLMILKDSPRAELRKLPKGIYIVNGRQINIR